MRGKGTLNSGSSTRSHLVRIILIAWSLLLGGCGNGENPLQSLAKLWSRSPATTHAEKTGTAAERTSGFVESDRRFVAFESGATHLISGDTNRAADIFLYDRRAKDTVRISIGMHGVQANGGSFSPEITPDGRSIVYESMASNLVTDDTNRQRDIFVYDRLSRTTSRVSVNSNGEQADNFSQSAHLSGDGRFIVFESLASNLVSGDTNNVIDIFVHDRQTKRTSRVSVGDGGAQADNASVNPTISSDGRYVTFDSFATNLTPEKSDGRKRTLVYDRLTGLTQTAADSDGISTPSLSHLVSGK